MAKTVSIAFPEMFNISQNTVATLEDSASIVNRTRLLILTEPTELHYNPEFGVGLKRHIFKYNNENEKAIIKNRIIEQLRLHEPYVSADDTQFSDGLLYTGAEDATSIIQEHNHLKMTITLTTTYRTVTTMDIDELVTSATSTSDDE